MDPTPRLNREKKQKQEPAPQETAPAVATPPPDPNSATALARGTVRKMSKEEWETLRSAIFERALLQSARDEAALVNVYTRAGTAISCRVVRFDRYTVHVEHDGRLKMLYKHAIECVEVAL